MHVGRLRLGSRRGSGRRSFLLRTRPRSRGSRLRSRLREGCRARRCAEVLVRLVGEGEERGGVVGGGGGGGAAAKKAAAAAAGRAARAERVVVEGGVWDEVHGVAWLGRWEALVACWWQ